MKGFAIITGSNGQMGSYIAELWDGPALLLYRNRTDRLADLATYPEKLLAGCDLMDLEGLHSAITKAELKFGCAPSVLIHTASVRSADALSVADSDPEVFQSVFSLNFTATYNIFRACLPRMRLAGFGRIVAFASDVAGTGLPNGAAYAAAKAAIVNLVKSAALENADANILINCVSPGPIDTRLEEDFQGEYLEFRRTYFQDFQTRNPTGKLVSKGELLTVVRMLCSGELQNLTGREIVINGGIT